jgi:hypothetical protein
LPGIVTGSTTDFQDSLTSPGIKQFVGSAFHCHDAFISEDCVQKSNELTGVFGFVNSVEIHQVFVTRFQLA